MEAEARAVDSEREPNFLLARWEKRLLRALAVRIPRFILPDDLSALGVLSAAGIFTAYVLSNGNPAWLWLASVLLVVHWLGDSLDGTLARVRGIQRPRYGYYLDHLVDAVATVLIGMGLGLSPYMLLSVGAVIVVAYLVLSINVYLGARRSGASRSATAGWVRPRPGWGSSRSTPSWCSREAPASACSAPT